MAGAVGVAETAGAEAARTDVAAVGLGWIPGTSPGEGAPELPFPFQEYSLD
jgi:hypothetical protein